MKQEFEMEKIARRKSSWGTSLKLTSFK
jgi:hypothetical protein